MSKDQQNTLDNFHKNFPFPTMRERQSNVLNEIVTAFASDYQYIILQAPTGYGKSPVAVAIALTLGSSYICTSTKDLQTQYARDFPFLSVAKGKNNFICAVKNDFILNSTYRCASCVSNSVNECYHKTADYGPCMSNRHGDCKYRTLLKHYKTNNKGTKEEEVFIDYDAKNHFQKEYSEWSHVKSLRYHLRTWMPCEYFDQLNIAPSHSIFNYSLFLALLTNKGNFLRTRNLLIVDEAHLLESEIVKFRGISISKRRWRKYISDLKMVEYEYDDVEKWIDFLIDIETGMLVLTGQEWKNYQRLGERNITG